MIEKIILIQAGGLEIKAELNDSPTAVKIWETLPVTGNANIWGDEIYFEFPVDMPQESDARQNMEVGELGYWPVGKAFCIFFGPTPVSVDDQPRAYSPVNIIGNVIGDATAFRTVQDDEQVQLIRFERD